MAREDGPQTRGGAMQGAGGGVPGPGDGDDLRIVSDGGAKQPLAHDAVADDPQPDRTQILLLRRDDSARRTLATASMAEAGRIGPALDSRDGSVIVSAIRLCRPGATTMNIEVARPTVVSA